MERKQNIPAWLSISAFVLILVSFVLFIIDAVQEDSIYILIHSLIYAFAACMAYVCCFMDSVKETASCFRLFCIAFAVYDIYFPFAYFSLTLPVISILHVAGFFLMAVFCLVTNLGKTASCLLSVLHFACSAAILAIAAENGLTLILPGSGMILSTLLLILIYGKYRDKESRNAK